MGGYGPITTTSRFPNVECYTLAGTPAQGPEHFWDRAQCGSNINGEHSCTSQGCLWGPLHNGSREPWCYHKFTHKCAVKERPQRRRGTLERVERRRPQEVGVRVRWRLLATC